LIKWSPRFFFLIAEERQKRLLRAQDYRRSLRSAVQGAEVKAGKAGVRQKTALTRTGPH
jgi:hypothetical protein